MTLPFSFEKAYHAVVNRIFKSWPRPRPDEKRMAGCRLVSHRGEHDNIEIMENTLPAFDKAAERGVWGLELDVRWTADLHPVVFHDPDLGRLRHDRGRLRDLALDELLVAHPMIPTLETIVRRYGGQRHLMVEIKEEHYPDPVRQSRILEDLFSSLAPVRDYHFISLAPRMFHHVDFAPGSAILPIGGADIRRVSRLALREGLGGVLGHFVLVTRGLMERHRAGGQGVGVGYADSKNVLHREVRRGVDWIFSNNAGKMQAICNGDAT